MMFFLGKGKPVTVLTCGFESYTPRAPSQTSITRLRKEKSLPGI